MRLQLPIAASVLAYAAFVVVPPNGLALAGDLDPPAGPITPTMKPLVEIEPRTAINATNTPGDADSIFKITQPGSYYLTGNITGVAAKNGIEIAADAVVLDLMGFQLNGWRGRWMELRSAGFLKLPPFATALCRIGVALALELLSQSMRAWKV